MIDDVASKKRTTEYHGMKREEVLIKIPNNDQKSREREREREETNKQKKSARRRTSRFSLFLFY